MTALHDLGAAQLSQAYAAGALSPTEVVRAVLAHIARWEPTLCATYALDADAALQAAAASTARWRAGRPLSPLDGVPCTVKENIATRGVPVPLGTAATVLVPAAADAPPAARLREAGCVILAKTTMPDWGMLSSGLSSFHRLARNPWNPAWNPGGSSAGAGAAAAAGYGPLHLGTDIGGSIRLPAAWCGVVGFKPSNGRIPIDPSYYGRVAGPMTRTVEDAALMMAVLAQPDARDAMSLPPAPLDWAAGPRDPRGLRVGLWLDGGWGLPVEPAVRAAVEQAAARFAAEGAVVEPVAPFTTRAMMDGLDNFWRMRSWMDHRRLSPERQAAVLPYIRAWIARGAELSGPQVFDGFSQMLAFRQAAVAATDAFDVVLSPVSPVPTYPAEWASPTQDPQRPLEHIAFTVPFNMSEQPAISVDAGRTADGRPIGLQIIGRRFDDVGVLRVARTWERLRPAPAPWPAPPDGSPGP
jgi:Asp-tRNA(Asn)/Glu-tRNA(Gln) amidotransferase A subunit family amidase